MTIRMIKLKNYMKKLIILFAFGLLARQSVQAQGSITYLSNLAQPSVSSLAVGSDSWLAADFLTGSNADGYLLDSIQLAMADAAGNPSGFMVGIYARDPHNSTDITPGDSLGILSGSLNPTTAGIYTYATASSLILSPSTGYFIVLTANTAAANGTYELSAAGASSYSPSGGWVGGNHLRISNNGSSWNSLSGTYPQFAINATPIPEPGVLSLLGLGGAALLWRRQAKTA
jgi:hypothetical protein